MPRTKIIAQKPREGVKTQAKMPTTIIIAQKPSILYVSVSPKLGDNHRMIVALYLRHAMIIACLSRCTSDTYTSEFWTIINYRVNSACCAFRKGQKRLANLTTCEILS